jgi:tRNA threonylcarbamoyladenosine biosynthesis protein TsaE
MGEYRTTSVDDTRQLAAVVAQLAQAGDIVVLAGEMGAGKTAFAQGFGAGLDIMEPITSPTFTLVHRYEGRLTMHHVDVYRLERMVEVADLGLQELSEEGVTLVEWGDVVAGALPADYLEVRLSFVEGGDADERTVSLRCVGRSWAARQRALHEALEGWR